MSRKGQTLSVLSQKYFSLKNCPSPKWGECTNGQIQRTSHHSQNNLSLWTQSILQGARRRPSPYLSIPLSQNPFSLNASPSPRGQDKRPTPICLCHSPTPLFPWTSARRQQVASVWRARASTRPSAPQTRSWCFQAGQRRNCAPVTR